jgi:hypothetical protein
MLMDDTDEHPLVEGLHRAASQRLNAITDLAQRQSGEAGSARSGQFHENAGIDAVRTVSGRTHKRGQRLTKLIAHFLRDVLYRVIDRGSKRKRAKVSII